jgi:hypothetical protein
MNKKQMIGEPMQPVIEINENPELEANLISHKPCQIKQKAYLLKKV